jgi:hypothetical protein
MTDTAYPPQRPLTVSEVLDLTFRIYRATLFSCVLFAALGVIGGQLPAIYSLVRGQRPGIGLQGITDIQTALSQAQSAYSGVVSVLYLVAMVLSMVFYGAVFLRQRALLTSRPTGGEAIAVLRRVPGLIGLGLLIVVTLIVCCLPGVVFLFPGAGLGTKILMALVVLTAISYALIAVSCALTIFYVDGSGATESFFRSWRLTAGSFWRLSVVYTVALIVLFVVDALVMGVTGFIGAVMGRADLAVVGALIGVVGVALGAFITPFYTALGLAVLGDLSARKEGADLERRIAAS